MLAFGVLVMAACIKLACCKCRDVNGVYVCADIPQSFPEGLKSILVFGTHVGELNSTVFASDALSSVTNLTLSNTATTAISPGALSKFQHLEVLDLSDNFLKKVTSIWLSHPDVLKNIIVSHNEIERIDITDLSSLFSLVSLDLSGNHIHVISQGSFSDLRSLQILDLSGNSLTYVNPEIFQPFGNTKIHLNGNPWDCYCGKPGFEDFVIFLQGLRSASRLENEVAVICNSPYPLKGAPVWNVSCPSPRPTVTEVPVTTEAAVTDSMATTVTLSPQRPSSGNTQGSVAKLVIGLPALVCLIVVLCALACIVCVLALLYHQKRKKKQIAPHATAQSDLHQTGFEQFPKTEAITSNLLRGRAKSAGPVMCRSEVLAKVTGMLPKDVGENGLHQSSEKNSLDGGTPAVVVTGNGSENTEKQNSEFLQGTERNRGSAGNTEEDLPYLTIGFKPPIEHSEDYGYDNTDKSLHIEKTQRHLVRVKTWPPTAIQWARQQAEQDETVDVSFFQKLQAELRLLKQEGTPNVNLKPVCPPGGSPISGTEPLSVAVPQGNTGKDGRTEERPGLGCEAGPSSLDDDTQGGGGTLPDTGQLMYHVTDVEPHKPIENTLRLEASKDGLEMGITTKKREEPEQFMLRLETTQRTSDGNNDVRLEMDISTQNREEPEHSILRLETSQRTSEGNNDVRLEMGIATQKTEEESTKEKSRTRTRQSKRRLRELESIRREGTRPRADESITGASALSKPSSPGDESLLQDNEYVFIDLLHEVVENHGRWTRERWRQSHLNKRKFQLK